MSEGKLIERLRTVVRPFFKRFDCNNDGKLGPDETRDLLDALGQKMQPAEFHGLFARADTDHSGAIEYSEFLRWIAQILMMGPPSPEHNGRLFRRRRSTRELLGSSAVSTDTPDQIDSSGAAQEDEEE